MANNRLNEWKNNQSSNDKRKYLNHSNRLSFKLTWPAINLIFSFHNLIFNGLQKIKTESSDDLCPFTVAALLTLAREYFYLQHINTSSSSISNLRELGKVKLFY